MALNKGDKVKISPTIDGSLLTDDQYEARDIGTIGTVVNRRSPTVVDVYFPSAPTHESFTAQFFELRNELVKETN